MPKKSRRAKAKQRAAVAKAVQERYPQQPKPVPAETQSTPRVSPRAQAVPKAQELTSRYDYIVPEMKRIGILAGSIILVLIILSFILG
jgi:hypothetical protein